MTRSRSAPNCIGGPTWSVPVFLRDGLMSLEKSRLTDVVGELPPNKLRELDNALIVALGIPTGTRPPVSRPI